MESAKVRALLYADIFDYPLTEIELEKWRINDQELRREFRTSVRTPPRCPKDSSDGEGITADFHLGGVPLAHHPRWVSEKCETRVKFEETEGYFYLKGREKIVKQRLEREKISQIKLEKAQEAAALLQKIPFIKLLAVTGSLAMQNSQKNDDIDFLIITQKGMLWLTRFLATLLLDLKGLRRKPHQKTFADKICLNMFLEDPFLELPKNEQDLYGAHEVYQTKPLFEKDNAYRRFLEANSWALRFLPGGKGEGEKGKGENKFIIPYTLNPLPFLEFLAKFFQLLHMRKRRTTEVILPHLIRFHPKDYRFYVLKRYAQKI